MQFSNLAPCAPAEDSCPVCCWDEPAGISEEEYRYCVLRAQEDLDRMTPEERAEDPSITLGDLIDYWVMIAERNREPALEPECCLERSNDLPF